MKIKKYLHQTPQWPKAGQHILAQFDVDSIYVYQAFCPAIAQFAVEHQKFGGEFSLDRMSWIKPNFLWMMYRSGWATKEYQERILAIRLRRTFFDEVLRQVISSTFDAYRFDSREQWQSAVASSEVRIQWDPDHDPSGKALERRAVQLGLRGKMLKRYAQEGVLFIEDITSFVVEQRKCLGNGYFDLQTPEERVYIPANAEAIRNADIHLVT